MAASSASANLDDTSSTKRSGSPSQKSQTSADDPDSLDLTGPNPTRDALADGIVTLLSPTLKTLDDGVLSTKRSQEELSEQISLLTDQLKLLAADQLCPIDLDGYVSRLGTIKGKINVISSVLHAAQETLNLVHEHAVKEVSRRKPLLEPSPVAANPAVAGQSSSTGTEVDESAESKPNTSKEAEEEDSGSLSD